MIGEKKENEKAMRERERERERERMACIKAVTSVDGYDGDTEKVIESLVVE